MIVKSESEVAQSCLTLSDPVDCSLPGSSAHGIFQSRVLEWGAIAFSIMESRKVLKCDLLVKLQEKEIPIHSSTLAWKLPWKEEPGRLQSM